MNENARTKGRAAIYSMAGVYLLYLSYSMYKEMQVNPADSGMFVMAAMVAFVVIGAGMIGFGIKMMSDVHKKRKNELEQANVEEVSEEE